MRFRNELRYGGLTSTHINEHAFPTQGLIPDAGFGPAPLDTQ
jgi:hypothetical protein